MSKRLGLFDDIIILSYYNWYYCTVLHCTMSRMNGKKTHTHTHSMLRMASVARVNRRLLRYYLIVRRLPNVFALACRSLGSI